ncbi:MAG: two-component system, chemotaxis family, response regulator WspR [Thiomicrorhabdus sp.]|nr:MAG: two-component system, chemotaxis family, response regulator WspR [Thiomicrorhabdus sp.]
MSGDQSESIDAVMKHLDNALWYANAMLNRGTNEKNEYHALTDESMIKQIELFIEKLQVFKQLTSERYANLSTYYVGSSIEQRYDEIFESSIVIAEEVEATLNKTVIDEAEKMASIHLIMAVIVLIFTFGMALRIKVAEKLQLTEIVARQELHKIAVISRQIDPLTGLANRKAFEEKLDYEFTQAMHKNTPVSLMLVEIDSFNEYKSHYGKKQAEKILIDTADVLKSICNSSSELVAHFGINYFVIVPTSSLFSRRIADALCRAVQQAEMSNEVSAISNSITISLGLVEMNPEKGIMLPDELMMKSREALALAKSEGGN